MELLIGDDDAICLLCQLYHESARKGGVTNDPIPSLSFPQSSGKMDLQFLIEVCWTETAFGSRKPGLPSSMQPSGMTTNT